jgi:hypothetical protein
MAGEGLASRMASKLYRRQKQEDKDALDAAAEHLRADPKREAL